MSFLEADVIRDPAGIVVGIDVLDGSRLVGGWAPSQEDAWAQNQRDLPRIRELVNTAMRREPSRMFRQAPRRRRFR